jgi:cation:H+ antiporter
MKLEQEAFFVLIDVLINIGILVISIFFLWKGSEWLVASAAKIGRQFHMSDLTIGLTIVAFGTSAPEFAVTLSAAISGMDDISVGNVIGSNIFNLGFILGGCALFRTLSTSRLLVYRDGFLLVATSLVLILFLHDHLLTRVEGGILFMSLIAYLVLLFKNKKIEDPSEMPAGVANWKDYPLLLLGIGSVVGGGHLLTESASDLAHIMGVSHWVIALTVVAAGTSAPELATSLMAASKGHTGMSLGNLVGSDLFNLLGVLGVAGIIRPMQVDKDSLSSILMLALMCTLAVIFMRTKWKINRWEGAVLIVIGLIRWGTSFFA